MAIVRKKGGESDRARRKVARGQIDDASTLRTLARDRGLATTPLDVEALARELGLSIWRKPLADNTSGFLKKTDIGWGITVNSLHHPNRQRFTIAHELAHYCLHRYEQTEFVDKILFRNEEANPMEREANRLAGELLVPEDELRSLMESGVKTVDQLATRFEVSSLALRVRAKQLGMSGHGL